MPGGHVAWQQGRTPGRRQVSTGASGSVLRGARFLGGETCLRQERRWLSVQGASSVPVTVMRYMVLRWAGTADRDAKAIAHRFLEKVSGSQDHPTCHRRLGQWSRRYRTGKGAGTASNLPALRITAGQRTIRSTIGTWPRSRLTISCRPALSRWVCFGQAP